MGRTVSEEVEEAVRWIGERLGAKVPPGKPPAVRPKWIESAGVIALIAVGLVTIVIGVSASQSAPSTWSPPIEAVRPSAPSSPEPVAVPDPEPESNGSPPPPLSPKTEERDEARAIHRALSGHLSVARGEMATLRSRLRRNRDDGPSLLRCGDLMRSVRQSLPSLRSRADALRDPAHIMLRAAAVGLDFCATCDTMASTEERCREAAADLATVRSKLKK